MNVIPYFLVFILASFLCVAQSTEPNPQAVTKKETVISYELDVSGKNGKNAPNGQSYSGQASEGRVGQSGGDAGTATEGLDAQNIELNISHDKSKPQMRNGFIYDANIILQGTISTAQGGLKKFGDKITIKINSLINIFARGGDGGDGGDGEQGGRGRDGVNATEWSDGTDGDNGERGGSNGLGSSGANAGDGGKVVIKIKEHQTYLLTLLDIDVSKGRGGDRGSNGRVGRGGQ